MKQDGNETPSETRIARQLLFSLQQEKNGGELVQLKCLLLLLRYRGGWRALTLNSSLTIIASSTSEAGRVVTTSLPGSLIPSVVAFFSISKSCGLGGGFFSKFLQVYV